MDQKIPRKLRFYSKHRNITRLVLQVPAKKTHYSENRTNQGRIIPRSYCTTYQNPDNMKPDLVVFKPHRSPKYQISIFYLFISMINATDESHTKLDDI